MLKARACSLSDMFLIGKKTFFFILLPKVQRKLSRFSPPHIKVQAHVLMSPWTRPLKRIPGDKLFSM